MSATVQSEQEHSLPAPSKQKLLPASTGGAPRSKAGSWVRKLLLVLVLLGAAALAVYKYRSNKKEENAANAKTAAAAHRAIPVSVVPVVSKTMPIYLNALGTVTAYNTVTVKSRVDGQLLSVNVREGQQVRKGQVIALIDPRPYEAALAQAQGQLAKDQASADYARAEAGRYTALYQAGVVSKESEQTQVSSAGASVGTLDADRAAIQAARVNVAYTRIVSPIDGVVGLRQVDAGNIVHAADTTGLIVVTQLQPIAVIFTLPEDHLPEVLGRIRNGGKLSVEAYDRGEVKHLATGTLLTVDNQIDTTTGTVKAKAVFDNRDGSLFPNQFVNIRLILQERQNSLVIPAAGLLQGAQGNFVYVVKPGNPPTHVEDDEDGTPGAPARKGQDGATEEKEQDAEQRPPRRPYYVVVAPVQLDLTEGSQVILKGGVNAGDQIVVDGQEKLKPYSKVDPRQSSSVRNAAAADRSSPSGTAAATSPQSTAAARSDTGSGSNNAAGRNP